MDARFWLVRTRPLEPGLLDVGHIYRELEGSSGTPFDTHEVLEAGAISRLAVLERREFEQARLAHSVHDPALVDESDRGNSDDAGRSCLSNV